MGKVVDTDLRVNGLSKLRVADVSILPVPLAGHYQCKIEYFLLCYFLGRLDESLILKGPFYAIAESAACLILGCA